MTFSEILDTGIVGKMLYDAGTSPSTPIWIVIAAVICIAVPYFLGSINFAIILSKTIYKTDIRELGSKNAGATNMMRIFGKKTAIMTFRVMRSRHSFRARSAICSSVSTVRILQGSFAYSVICSPSTTDSRVARAL